MKVPIINALALKSALLVIIYWLSSLGGWSPSVVLFYILTPWYLLVLVS